MKYFAYGSNMSTRRIQERVPSATKVAVGALQSHQLRFHKYSTRDESGKCDAFKTSDAKDRLFGVVFEIAEEEKAGLDQTEGLGYGYDEKTAEVHLFDGTVVQAFTYIATNIDESLRPLDWYKEHVVRGARENELPEYYVKLLEARECDEDPDSVRRDRELAVYR
jgi:cation transport regulator ChaC